MNTDTELKDIYVQAKTERQNYINKIINSSARKKIVVAGPGTGKTFLFKEVLNGKTDTLTLTFVNALVEELSLELYGLSDVKTLHSFARSSLGNVIGDVKIFPKLAKVIREDAKIILSKDIDFDELFHNRKDTSEFLDFYKKRKNYYGYYGYSDIIFALVKFYEKRKDKIPTFQHVVVDEFQDFNKLEVSLIDLLSEKSPILLAGDDDQALYDFKSASTEFIRRRFIDADLNYTPFSLPFCSRCTRVIVNAASDIINKAKENNLLKGRAEKNYQYFDDKDKDIESKKNPKIVYNYSYERQIPWFIEKSLGEIACQIKNKFSVLIISPTKLKSRAIVDALKNKGFENIEYVEKEGEKDATIFDGLKLLLDDEKSNLGWRIVAKFILNTNEFVSLLTNTFKEETKNISDFIDKKRRKEVSELLTLLRAVKMDKSIDEKTLDSILKKVGLDPYEMARDLLKNKIATTFQHVGNPGLRKIRIKATTIQSSKGLAADCVFVTHFDDLFFIKDKDKTKISDKDICNFLVVLTRARKKIFLISSNQSKEPTFLKWINPDYIERI